MFNSAKIISLIKFCLRDKNLNIFFSVFLFIGIRGSYAQAPDWQWAKNAVGNNSESGNCITTDATGNVFVAGYFYSPTIIFETFTLTNTGNYDFYVVKYDAAGNVLWAKSGGGIYDDVAQGVAADQAGNVYVTGYFYSPSITVGAFTLTNAGVGDIFIVKYNSAGNEIWTKSGGGTNDENGNAIATDAAGNIFVTGFFQSASVVFDTYTLTNTGANDIFIVKYNGSGNVIWAKGIEGTTGDVGNSVDTDAGGNVYVTGSFNSPSLILDTYTLTNAGSSDVFITKYDGLGNSLWAKSAGGTFNDSGLGIALDQGGNVFVTGSFISPTLTAETFSLTNTGNFDFYILKYDGLGNALWARSEGSVLDETGLGVATDPAGNVYVTGHFHSPSFTIGTYTLNNEGIGDFYIVQYDNSGNLIWAKSNGGTADDGCSAITTDALGNIFITGYFISPTLAYSGYTLINSGSEDMFIAKLESTITNAEDHVTQISDNEIYTYPNPSAGIFTIEGNRSIIDGIEIFNNVGVKIFGFENTCIKKSVIDISGNPPGIYFLKIKTVQGYKTKKIIIG